MIFPKLFQRDLDKFDILFLFLAFLMVPMLLWEYLLGASFIIQDLFRAYYLFLWAVFSLEFIIRLSRVQSKRKYFVQNWIEVVIILFPFLRIFRFIRFFEVALLILVDRSSKIFPPFRRHSFFNLLVLVFVVVAISSELILSFEKNQVNSSIRTFNDAIWWSTVGISTIGIGNIIPESIAGRYLTLILMVVGVFVFSVLTANIAAIFTEEEVREDINKELKTIEGDLAKVEKDIEGEIAVEDKTIETKLQRLESRLSKIEKNKK